MEHFGYVLATKMLVEGKRKVRYMYHEEPDNSRDSGWRFFCGDEDDETATVRNIIHVAYDEQPDPLELFGNDIIYKKRYDNKKDE